MSKVEVFDSLKSNCGVSENKLDHQFRVSELITLPGNDSNPDCNTIGRRSRKIQKGNETAERIFELNHGGKDLTEAIYKLWEVEQLCDVILSVENTKLKAHRVVLAACSGYFYDHFITADNLSAVSELPFSKLPLIGSRSNIMRKILCSVYSSKITLDSSCVGDILAAASFLRISSIVDACQSYLGNTLCPENCIRNLKVASRYKLDILMDETCKYISCNFKDVSKQTLFNGLSVMEMIGLIKRQDIVVDSEIEIFYVVVKWIEHDKPIRSKYTARLMQYVRFGVIAKNQLVDNVESCNLVSECSALNEYVKEAMRYQLLPFRRSILQSQRTIPRSAFTMNVAVASGGLTANNECWTTTGNIFYHDTNQNRWLPFGELPEPRHHHAVATLGNFLYVAGGTFGLDDQTSSRKAWRFDPYTETWLRIANMLQARQTFQIEALDSRLYAVGGRNDTNRVLSSVERYNPSTNAWSNVESISSPRRYVALASAGGRLYAVGGFGTETVTRMVERFNPVSSHWEKLCPLRKPRFGGALHSVNENLWLIGGATLTERGRTETVVPTKSIDVYSTTADQWTTVEAHNNLNCGIKNRDESSDAAVSEDYLKTLRTEAGSCVVNDEIFLVAGFTGSKSNLLNDVERLTVCEKAANSAQASRNATQAAGEDELDLKAAKEQPSNYPYRCTGVACATLTLYKRPKYNKSLTLVKEVPVDTETTNY